MWVSESRRRRWEGPFSRLQQIRACRRTGLPRKMESGDVKGTATNVEADVTGPERNYLETPEAQSVIKANFDGKDYRFSTRRDDKMTQSLTTGAMRSRTTG